MVFDKIELSGVKLIILWFPFSAAWSNLTNTQGTDVDWKVSPPIKLCSNDFSVYDFGMVTAAAPVSSVFHCTE